MLDKARVFLPVIEGGSSNISQIAVGVFWLHVEKDRGATLKGGEGRMTADAEEDIFSSRKYWKIIFKELGPHLLNY